MTCPRSWLIHHSQVEPGFQLFPHLGKWTKGSARALHMAQAITMSPDGALATTGPHLEGVPRTGCSGLPHVLWQCSGCWQWNVLWQQLMKPSDAGGAWIAHQFPLLEASGERTCFCFFFLPPSPPSSNQC